MVAQGQTMRGNGKLGSILEALQESADKTIKYMTRTLIFYVVLIAVFVLLTITANKSEARWANFFILILVSLGFLGMWISPLRGLKKTGIGIGGFLNLFHLPLKDRIKSLEDASAWSDPEERLNRAEEFLKHQAAAEKEMRAWPNRLLSLTVITAIDLLVWLVADNWLVALINEFIAVVVSQAHITMAPTASIKAMEAGRDG